MKTPAIVARMYFYCALLHVELAWMSIRDYYAMWLDGRLSDYLWYGLLTFGITYVPIVIGAYLAASGAYLLIASLAFAVLKYQRVLKWVTMLGFLAIPGGTLAGICAYRRQHDVWYPARIRRQS
ncbi:MULTISPECIES: hypothetical protein [unclassified Lysobacter]|uniref:hypothetical protein n=1 Tax=unclassified Lysobacter TaxID=2635362 RepID=UPI001BE8ACBE|nr:MULTISPECIES: hypothetical protein [unclassified Lysobacter]MBT2748330.1 hypothetical protein [Lysobacter sp. ISL-42]MBT2749903.1 hypothetical protein [Lysobacter sp. ISL-50]MBT2781231.1 hypothetical protein [Lysobacter sp. ISL-52]